MKKWKKKDMGQLRRLIKYGMRFIDGFRFMSTALSNLANSIKFWKKCVRCQNKSENQKSEDIKNEIAKKNFL